MMIMRDSWLASHPGLGRFVMVAATLALVTIGLRAPIVLVAGGLLLWFAGLTSALAAPPATPGPPGRPRDGVLRGRG